MVVARFPDGRVIKGTTVDFDPVRPTFHVFEGGDETAPPVAVTVANLKAIFFVKSLAGEPEHRDAYCFERARGYGRHCHVWFKDGEVLAGYTAGYSASRPGFFVVPADLDGNNDRVFVVNGAVKSVTWV
jgi:hypothetical protein